MRLACTVRLGCIHGGDSVCWVQAHPPPVWCSGCCFASCDLDCMFDGEFGISHAPFMTIAIVWSVCTALRDDVRSGLGWR
ncbi:hypothetical protein BDQ94DRAFT_151447 [Aspergillus welwitschiae]|uniref:Uncharacterized protein n=1 Tax=Aspergillus welwitschiae TaxID=1341132 RepID=A0A3F3PP87_9EURO|nr:hypothetical protein BDQ94DRAFT_151447 [Aspergillus welwitschiae]RDH28734.1 hypothetical protein BDQ94DRAFT_151447 [Aspergillus welwitschiae]